ncbi:RidA family protein [Parapusillimonas granuli]|uniref:RidA family protein n=1 Tax=Parapusillimonas granuli TaxID=380911 RepID=A0A853FZ59_9BURK|nr:RidA family protein [Parapusillimonas granuli]MBB5214290.1 enamine deaminase RidA (YjgF/YER057c/UK114 family) [Parapusillimonas granuli]NYT51394.1 RidA family protein [Parapusillimonas granuli]
MTQATSAPIERLNPKQRYSPVVVANSTVYIAGQVSRDTRLDVAGQTADILAQLDSLLASAGIDKRRLVQATIWLSDMNSAAAMNSVWDGWVAPRNAPARACVESKLAPGYLVEIAATAVL